MKSKIFAVVLAIMFCVGAAGAVYTSDPPVQNVIAYTENAVVVVTASGKDPDGKEMSGLGTGFFIGDNEIVTNNHVIMGNAPGTKITVYDKTRTTEYKVKVKYTDPVADIAVLQLDNWDLYKEHNPDWIYLRFDTTFQQGDKVIVIGHPTGLLYSASVGIVSQPKERIDPANPKWFIGTDAHLYPGNSGGPLLDADGELLGVNDIMLTNEGGSYGFAIPAVILEKILSDFHKYGEVRWATLGISMEKNVVSHVNPDSAASAAGIFATDQILFMIVGKDQYKVNNVDDIINVLATIDYQTPITFMINGKPNVTVTPTYRTSKDFEGTK